MARKNVTVPPTRDQGNAKFNASDSYCESVAKNALWTYNSMRAHDGLPPLARMPRGTRYAKA